MVGVWSGSSNFTWSVSSLIQLPYVEGVGSFHFNNIHENRKPTRIFPKSRYGSPSGLQGERSWLQLCPRRLRSQSASSCKASDMTRTFVKECSVYSGQCSLGSVMRIHEVISHYSALLFPFAVHSHMFSSWQVNGSDGMYKYEEIILERVSFKSLQLGSFHL